MKLKEGEEKQRRAREAREKAEAEKAARAARKRALVDMNAHETQEGVMDSLMEALQTGSAFSRPDQRRKRQTRVAGGKFYRTFIWRRMEKRDQAAQLHMFNNTLSTKLIHDYENVTPTETMRRNMLSNRIVTKLCTADESTSFFTPEENQELYKQMLLDEAKKTPRHKKRSSRVTYFQKKRQCSRCNLAYYTAMPFNETPKRDILLKTFTNLESRCTNTDWESSPMFDENVSINRARIISPVKQRRVVISKIRKRNSIVRRAISNRKRLRANNKIAKRRSHNYLQSPPNMSITMPLVVNSSAVSSNFTQNAKMSRSIDGIHTKIFKTACSPMKKKLLRSKNFENLARYKDETQNILDTKSKSLNSSISTQFSTDKLTNAQSPLLIEMSGVTLLSGNSPLHLIKPNSDCTKNMSGKTLGKLSNESFVLETSSSNAIYSFSNNQMKKPKDRSWKKKWKFWHLT